MNYSVFHVKNGDVATDGWYATIDGVSVGPYETKADLLADLTQSEGAD